MQSYRMLWARLHHLSICRTEVLVSKAPVAQYTGSSGLHLVRCISTTQAQEGSVKRKAWHNQTMKELRKELETRGLSANGKKSTLVDRLKTAEAEAKARAREASSSAPDIASAPEAFQEPEAASLQSKPAEQHTDQGPASQPAVDPQSQAAQPPEATSFGPADEQQNPLTSAPQGSPASLGQLQTRGVSTASIDSRASNRHQRRQGKRPDNMLPEPDHAADATGLAVTWLGTSSGAPTQRRNVSSIALRTAKHTCVVDCGEGTLNQLRSARMDPARVSHICITHMHGDHCFGLPGMLRTVSDARAARGSTTEPLTVFGPPGLHLLLESALSFAPQPLSMPLLAFEFAVQPQRSFRPRAKEGLGTELQFGCLAPDRTPRAARALKQAGEYNSVRTDQNEMHEVPVVPGLVWSLPGPSGLRITAAQLQHRVPCWGYVFQEAGSPESQGRKVVLLGDTAGSQAMLEPGMGADLLSHEATFSMDMAGKARIAQHSTARDAGRFAAALQAQTLVLTHFSNRYSFEGSRPMGGQHLEASTGDISMLCKEASYGFRSNNIIAANDFYTFKVPTKGPVAAADGNGRHSEQRSGQKLAEAAL